VSFHSDLRTVSRPCYTWLAFFSDRLDPADGLTKGEGLFMSNQRAYRVSSFFFITLLWTVYAYAQDTQPPTIVSLTFSPTTVNIATSDQTVNVDVRLKDDLSGVQGVGVIFASPSGKQETSGFGSLISGTDLDGIWRVKLTIKRYAETGQWRLSLVMFSDNAGNAQFPFCEAACLQSINAPTILTVTATSTNLKPEITNPGPQISDEGSSVNLKLLASDPDGDPLSFSVSGLPKGLSVNSSSGLISGTLSYTSAGSYTVKAKVSDGSASAETTFPWTVNNVNRAPQVSNPGEQRNRSGDAIELRIQASDPDGDPLQFAAIGLPTGISLNSNSGIITGVLDESSVGRFTVELTVTDNEAETSVSFNWIIEPEVKTIVYPQMAVGGGFSVVLLVSNLSDLSWTGTGKLKGNNWSSTPWNVNDQIRLGYDTFDIHLTPHQTRQIVLTSEAETKVGWLEITSETGSSLDAFAVSFFYNYCADGILIDSTGVPPARPVRKIVFPFQRSGPVNTGIAIRRPEGPNSSTPFIAKLIDANGLQVASVETDLTGARFVNEIFSSNGSDTTMGYVLVESTEPFYAVILRFEGTEGGFQLTSIPAEESQY